MESRPKIKLFLSGRDKASELICKTILICMWGFTFFAFFGLPATIPTHFNAMGQADSYGNKMTLFILPAIATIIYFGLTQLVKYPHVLNYMSKITEENAREQYTMATRLLRLMKLFILIIFTGIVLFTYLTSKGVTDGLGFWFLPLTIGLILIPTIIALSQLLKKKNKPP